MKKLISVGYYPKVNFAGLIKKYRSVISTIDMLLTEKLKVFHLFNIFEEAIINYVTRGINYNSKSLDLRDKLTLIESLDNFHQLINSNQVNYIYADKDDYINRKNIDELLIVFIHLRTHHLETTQVSNISRLTEYCINSIEQSYKGIYKNKELYIQLVSKLIWPEKSIEDVFEDNKKVNNVTESISIPGIPDAWVQWGLTLNDTEAMSNTIAHYKKIRRNLRITQKELSEITDIKQSNISSMEKTGFASKKSFIKYCYWLEKLK